MSEIVTEIELELVVGETLFFNGELIWTKFLENRIGNLGPVS